MVRFSSLTRDEEIDVTATSRADIITQYRPYYLGSSQPDCYGGFQNRFVYRNWGLCLLDSLSLPAIRSRDSMNAGLLPMQEAPIPGSAA